MILSLAASAGLILAVGGEDVAVQDAAKLEGVWRFDMVEVDGAKRPELPFDSNKVIIQKSGRFVILQGPRVTHGIIKLDPSKSPKQYDSTLTRGPAKDLTFPCIYELEGDSFKLCGPYAGGERPTEFATAPDSGLVMQVLKREKQSAQDALLEAAGKELAGEWHAVACVRDGKAESDTASQTKLAFEPDAKTMDTMKATEAGPDNAPAAATVKIDALVDPMAVDISYLDGRKKGQTVLGIATVDGNTLTMCFAAPGQPRPTELLANSGSGRTLMTYQRAAAEKK